MRRVFLSFLILAAGITAFAQNQTEIDWSSLSQDFKDQIKEAMKEEKEYSPVVAQTDDGQFKLYTSSYVGYSLYFVRSNSFAPTVSGEFFVNLVGGGFYPMDNLGFEVNLDLGHNTFRSTESVLYLDGNREVTALDNKLYYPFSVTKPRSTLSFFSINLPLQAKYYMDDFSFGLGTEIGINFPGRVNHKYSDGYDTYSTIQKRAAVNTFTYAILGTVTYDKVTLFLKFYPRSAGILSGRNIDMGYASLGLAFRM